MTIYEWFAAEYPNIDELATVDLEVLERQLDTAKCTVTVLLRQRLYPKGPYHDV